MPCLVMWLLQCVRCSLHGPGATCRATPAATAAGVAGLVLLGIWTWQWNPPRPSGAGYFGGCLESPDLHSLLYWWPWIVLFWRRSRCVLAAPLHVGGAYSITEHIWALYRTSFPFASRSHEMRLKDGSFLDAFLTMFFGVCFKSDLFVKGNTKYFYFILRF